MNRKTATAIFLVSLLIVLILAPFSSPLPDGLEKVAEKLGISKFEQQYPISFLFPDYEASFVKSPYLKVVLPGIFGLAITFAFTAGLYLIISRAKI